MCNAFATLFKLVVHKDVRVVADVWDSSREDGVDPQSS